MGVTCGTSSHSKRAAGMDEKHSRFTPKQAFSVGLREVSGENSWGFKGF